MVSAPEVLKSDYNRIRIELVEKARDIDQQAGIVSTEIKQSPEFPGLSDDITSVFLLSDA